MLISSTLTKSYFRLKRSFRVWYVNRYTRPNNDFWKTTAVGLFILLIWLWSMNQDYKELLKTEVDFKESYLAVVLAAMNGDARFQVGEELFECRGGRL